MRFTIFQRAAFGMLVVTATGFAAIPAAAQQALVNPQRDCQTLLTCQFARGGSYRGCVSSYSCRTCDFITSKCKIAGVRGKVCRKLRCSWGG